ncbi:MAG: hypothetical protein AB1668_02880 [Nanoarchaeota archaeon]
MAFKKAYLIFVMFLLIGAMSASFVSAEEPWDTMKSIVTLGFMQHLGLKSSVDPFEGLIRFMLLIALFAILFKVAELLKLGKNVAIVIAAALSIMTVFFIPGTILVAAAASYGTIFSVVLLGIPIALMIFAYVALKEHRWVRVGVMALLIYVLHVMKGHISAMAVSAGAKVSPYAKVVLESVNPFLDFVIVIAWVVGLYSLFTALANTGGSTDQHPNWLKGLWNRAMQQTVLTEKGKELRHARVEETRLLSDLAVEKEELGLLENAKEKGESYQVIFDEIKNHNRVNSLHHLTSLDAAFKRLKLSFDDVTDVQHRWKRAERKEMAETKRLIKEMINKGVLDKTRKPIEEMNTLILGEYAKVSDAVKKAEGALKKVGRNHDSFYDQVERLYEVKAGGERTGIGRNQTDPIDNLGSVEPEVKSLIKAIGDNLSLFLAEIETARKGEELAVNTTTKLAEEIKKNWVV